MWTLEYLLARLLAPSAVPRIQWDKVGDLKKQHGVRLLRTQDHVVNLRPTNTPYPSIEPLLKIVMAEVFGTVAAGSQLVELCGSVILGTKKPYMRLRHAPSKTQHKARSVEALHDLA